MVRMLITLVLTVWAGLSMAQPVQLISDEEARLPAASQAPSRAITRGPGVKLVSPEAVSAGGFALKIAFEPRGGSKVDPASVQVVYLKNPVVDITSRLKAGISPAGIDMASAKAPAGEHPIRVTVRDDEGRQGVATFNLMAK